MQHHFLEMVLDVDKKPHNKCQIDVFFTCLNQDFQDLQFLRIVFINIIH